MPRRPIVGIPKAAKSGDEKELCRLLALHPHLIDIRYNAKHNPMITAALQGHVHIIEALVRLGSKSVNKCKSKLRFLWWICGRPIPVSVDITLRYLGATSELSDYDEEEAAKIRHRVFFQRSLLQRCFDYSKQCSPPTKRI